MSTENRRRHHRLTHSAKIKVITKDKRMYLMDMQNQSESGAYLSSDRTIAKMEDIVEIQTTELLDAPIVSSRVVRVDSNDENKGYALEYLATK
jgi:hypothetical protein